MGEAVWRRVGRAALGVLQPPRCLGCDGFLGLSEALARELEDARAAQTAAPRWFCEACLPRLKAVEAPWRCPRCALPTPPPLEGLDPVARRCVACAAEAPPWGEARAAFEFGGPAREAVLRLKLGPDASVAVGLAALLADALRRDPIPGLDWGAVCWVPIPVSAAVLRSRGFNQAALVAEGLARRLGGRVEGPLARAREVAPQRSLDRAGRQENLVGAFEARAGWSCAAPVVLVDDVITTGATLREAARALEGAAAAVAFARTP
jgi:predicted amidophosphoribosyltransferase